MAGNSQLSSKKYLCNYHDQVLFAPVDYYIESQCWSLRYTSRITGKIWVSVTLHKSDTVACRYVCMQRHRKVTYCTYMYTNFIDHMWLDLASTHNYKYLEILILIIWSILSQEGKQIFACNLPWLYSYLWSVHPPTVEWIVSWIAHHFR